LGERFKSKVLPLFKRQTKQVRDLIPELYLHDWPPAILNWRCGSAVGIVFATTLGEMAGRIRTVEEHGD
jgi:hypothetical protein